MTSNPIDSRADSLSDEPKEPESNLAGQAGPLRQGEYARKGEFHRNLDPNWSYAPIYINKIEVVDALLSQYHKPSGAILDAGCGEGVLVEKYAQKGLNITGLDKNYASEWVQQGSLTEMPFENNTFETVMALDVLEHLLYPDQSKAMAELVRVLKPGGVAIFSCPNLAHFTSRLKFLFRGRLLRTATIGHHPGDRPYLEYKQLFEQYGFEIIETQGIFPTIPPIYRWVMRYPAKCAGLLRFLRTLPLPIDWHFQVLFACRLKG